MSGIGLLYVDSSVWQMLRGNPTFPSFHFISPCRFHHHLQRHSHRVVPQTQTVHLPLDRNWHRHFVCSLVCFFVCWWFCLFLSVPAACCCWCCCSLNGVPAVVWRWLAHQAGCHHHTRVRFSLRDACVDVVAGMSNEDSSKVLMGFFFIVMGQLANASTPN